MLSDESYIFFKCFSICLNKQLINGSSYHFAEIFTPLIFPPLTFENPDACRKQYDCLTSCEILAYFIDCAKEIFFPELLQNEQNNNNFVNNNNNNRGMYQSSMYGNNKPPVPQEKPVPNLNKTQLPSYQLVTTAQHPIPLLMSTMEPLSETPEPIGIITVSQENLDAYSTLTDTLDPVPIPPCGPKTKKEPPPPIPSKVTKPKKTLNKPPPPPPPSAKPHGNSNGPEPIVPPRPDFDILLDIGIPIDDIEPIPEPASFSNNNNTNTTTDNQLKPENDEFKPPDEIMDIPEIPALPLLDMNSIMNAESTIKFSNSLKPVQNPVLEHVNSQPPSMSSPPLTQCSSKLLNDPTPIAIPAPPTDHQQQEPNISFPPPPIRETEINVNPTVITTTTTQPSPPQQPISIPDTSNTNTAVNEDNVEEFIQLPSTPPALPPTPHSTTPLAPPPPPPPPPVPSPPSQIAYTPVSLPPRQTSYHTPPPPPPPPPQPMRNSPYKSSLPQPPQMPARGAIPGFNPPRYGAYPRMPPPPPPPPLPRR